MPTRSPKLSAKIVPELFRLGGTPPGTQPVGNVPADLAGTARARISEALVRHKKSICTTAASVVCQAYGFQQKYGEAGHDKCVRDLSHVVDYIALAVLVDSVDFLEDKILYWFRLVLDHLNFPGHEESIRAAYSIMRTEAYGVIPPEFHAHADPFLQRVLLVLSRDTQPRIVKP